MYILVYVQDFPVYVQVFQALPLFIRRRVLKEGRVLLVKYESRLYEVACRTAQAFEDFRPAYEDYLAQVARGRSDIPPPSRKEKIARGVVHPVQPRERAALVPVQRRTEVCYR